MELEAKAGKNSIEYNGVKIILDCNGYYHIHLKDMFSVNTRGMRLNNYTVEQICNSSSVCYREKEDIVVQAKLDHIKKVIDFVQAEGIIFSDTVFYLIRMGD